MTAPATAAVIINGAPTRLEPGTTVEQLVRHLGHPSGRGVAVAQNGTVVPRSQWADTEVADGDRIEVLVAAQGG